jgi:hypothetical protein
MNRTLSIVTTAAVVGLFVLNYKNTVALIDALGKATVGYIGAIQGRDAAA